MTVSASNIPIPPHPFYPPEINLVGYLANDWDVPTLVGLFFGGWAVISAVTISGIRWYNPRLGGWDQATTMWFVLCK
jgi:cholestenol Delta-isomerase